MAYQPITSLYPPKQIQVRVSSKKNAGPQLFKYNPGYHNPYTYVLGVINDLRKMWPYVKKYGLRYVFDYEYRCTMRKKEIKLRKRRKYGNNYYYKRKRWVLELIFRDGPGCKLCHGVGIPLTIDHITRLVDGGKNHLPNMQLLCEPCHVEKSRQEVLADNAKKQ